MIGLNIMTENHAFKQQVRARMSVTGECYAVARTKMFVTQSSAAKKTLYPEQLFTDDSVVNLKSLAEDDSPGMILFAGTCGSGKTTSMAAYLNMLVRDHDKHVTVVDSDNELSLYSDTGKINFINVADSMSINGQSNWDIWLNGTSVADSVMKNTKKDNVDVLVFGEIRQHMENFESLSNSMITASTIHASDAYVAINRSYDLGQEIGRTLPVKAVIETRRVVPAGSSGAIVLTNVIKTDSNYIEAALGLATYDFNQYMRQQSITSLSNKVALIADKLAHPV